MNLLMVFLCNSKCLFFLFFYYKNKIWDFVDGHRVKFCYQKVHKVKSLWVE